MVVVVTLVNGMNIIGEKLKSDTILNLKNARILLPQTTPDGRHVCMFLPTHEFAKKPPEKISINFKNVIHPVLEGNEINEEIVKHYEASVAGIVLP